MKKVWTIISVVVCVTLSLDAICQQEKQPGSYVILTSQNTHADKDWNKVVEALKKKHNATVLVYADEPAEVLPALRQIHPKYVALVVKWQEVSGRREDRLEATGSPMIRKMHNLSRIVDDDPYGDFLWGVITGLDHNDAMKLVEAPARLEINYAFLKTGGGYLDHFKSGTFISEGDDRTIIRKEKDKKEETKSPEDTTDIWTELINQNKVDFILTSGHATDVDWQAGYPPRRDGQIRSKNGKLYSYDLKRKRYEIKSTNPKIYHGCGNCLIGLISGENCMVLAWIRSGGVVQFCGYTVVTAFGYMGWGINHYFMQLEDTFSFSEAFFVNNQALLFDLKNNVKGVVRGDKIGYLHDKDSVAFYGDPALEAKIVPAGNKFYTQSLSVKEIGKGRHQFKFEIKLERDVSLATRPAFVFLPYRVGQVKVISSDAKLLEITDDFVIARFQVPGEEPLKKGTTKSIVFEASPLVSIPVEPPPADKNFRQNALKGLPEEIQNKIENALKDNLRAFIFYDLLSRYSGEKKEALAFLIMQLSYRRTNLYADLGSHPLDMWYTDIDVVDSYILIDTLELAYAAREKFAWAKELDKDTFFRYVLIYKGTCEWVENWRRNFWGDKDLHQKVEEFNTRYKNAKTKEEKKKVFRELIYFLNTEWLAKRVEYKPRGKPELTPSELLEGKIGRCTDLTNAFCAIARTYGIATTGVRVIAWPNRESNHYWATVYSPVENGWLDIESGLGGKFSDAYFECYRFSKSPDRFVGKAYKVVPGEEEGLMKVARGIPRCPSLFGSYAQNLPLVDVTERYSKVVTREFEGMPAGGYVFLAVKNDGSWQEVAVEKADENGVVRFKNIGAGIDYRLYVYRNGKRKLVKEFSVGDF